MVHSPTGSDKTRLEMFVLHLITHTETLYLDKYSLVNDANIKIGAYLATRVGSKPYVSTMR
jgi:hypothetical protein